MPGEPVKIGQAVADMREARGWTQAELAKKCSMGVGSLQHIERDRRGASPRAAKAIADAFEVPVTYLYLLAEDSEDKLLKKFQRVARKLLGIQEEASVR